MGIISVAQPKAQSQRVERDAPREDPLDKIANIGSALQQNELRGIQITEAKRQSEQRERVASGDIEQRDIAETGLSPVQEGQRGFEQARQFNVKTKSAEETKSRFFHTKEQVKKFAQQAEDEASKLEKKNDRLDRLSTRFDNSSDKLGSKDAIVGFNKVRASAETSKPTGASDLALIFNYMKVLDPGSVVRESEFRTAEESSPLDERVFQLREKYFSQGQKLSPKQRARILMSAKENMLAQLDAQEETNVRFTTLSEQFGLDPDLVIDQQFTKLRTDLLRELRPQQQRQLLSGAQIPGESQAQAAETEGDFLNRFLTQPQPGKPTPLKPQGLVPQKPSPLGR